ncbi:MAG TPA: hypothetical protein P5567_07715 [Kiritimatiellia bacterium]|nr:hypothetical protein [Kiritimatiellia bacterium]HRZ12325.1 hypothetical protein [Kiritimatiellia bacterium]HSA17917.1 hypothetical protein [Kiritimatiellia bacterium]
METPQVQGQRVEVDNGRLTVSFSLGAAPGPAEKDRSKWTFAGAANSVRYHFYEHRLEMLDLFNHHMTRFNPDGHEPEKRCMQIQRLTLFDSRLGTDTPVDVDVFNLEYIRRDEKPEPPSNSDQVVFIDCPLDGNLLGINGLSRCRLRRTLTWKNMANYVLEHMDVVMDTPSGVVDAIEFQAQFLACMDFGLAPQKKPNKDSLEEGWFTCQWLHDSPFALRFAYGFACNTGLQSFENPVPNYPTPGISQKTRFKTYSWIAGKTKSLDVAHLFTYGTTTDSDGTLIRRLRTELPPSGGCGLAGGRK